MAIRELQNSRTSVTLDPRSTKGRIGTNARHRRTTNQTHESSVRKNFTGMAGYFNVAIDSQTNRTIKQTPAITMLEITAADFQG